MQLTDDVLSRHEVRLFPSVRISSDREAELRATAALLSIVKGVSEFGRAVVSMAGGPRGRLECYTEPPFAVETPEKQRELRPDGLFRVRRGERDWKALVEVKVGDNVLDQEQFDAYHRLAKPEGIDAIITISNQAALSNGLPPLNVDKRRLRSVPVTHISWERLLSEAQVLSRRKEVEDPDQQWMLEEWIRYLADPASQIIEPPHLGEYWNEVLRAARSGSLETASKQLLDVVERWVAFQRKVAMRLRAKLGVDVQPRMPRAERAEPTLRTTRLHKEALGDGILSAAFRIPDAVGDVSLTILLAGRTVRYGVALKAPVTGRAKTRLNWLVRQLRSGNPPNTTTVDVEWDKRHLRSHARLSSALEDVSSLLRDTAGNPIPTSALPRSFSVESTTALVKGRGRSTAPVLEGIAVGLEQFYKEVVEDLRAYVPPAPRLPLEAEEGSPSEPKSPDRTLGVAVPIPKDTETAS